MRRALVVALALVALSCAEEEDRLSDWGLFADGATQTPVEGVVPYELISPLFSDYAVKHRFIRLPEGGRITYTESGDWVYPVGTVLVKTFGFLNDRRDPSAGERIVETRLLSLEEDGRWHPYVYAWNDDATEAVRAAAGRRVPVEWIHDDGSTVSIEYRVPNEVQCANCHGGTEDTSPIGPRTEQLDRDNDYGAGPENQIDHMVALGWFDGPVPAFGERPRFEDPMGTGDLNLRARAYLDANCSGCHQETGVAGQSGLWLNAFITNDATIGICKEPVAAGRAAGGRPFDIVPGDPDNSVMVYRMESEEPGVKMPELPSVLSHREGVGLIREWIAAMPPGACM